MQTEVGDSSAEPKTEDVDGSNLVQNAKFLPSYEMNILPIIMRLS